MSGTWVEDDGVLEAAADGTVHWLVTLAMEWDVAPADFMDLLRAAPSAGIMVSAIVAGVSAAELDVLDLKDAEIEHMLGDAAMNELFSDKAMVQEVARGLAAARAAIDLESGQRTCPRCNDIYDSRKPAGSRSTPGRDVEVCGACGYDEAQYDANGIRLQLVAEWPVVRRYELQPAE